jgi:DNA-directed RNA polymerase subunit RPC12/RpoP
MGKSYLFECEKCGYRVIAAGGLSEGNDLKVQTIHCRDCRSLQDCVVALRTNAPPNLWQKFTWIREEVRPDLKTALNRLPLSPLQKRHWIEFAPACPVDESHRIEQWKTPGRCPKCKSFIEGRGLPYRVWD